MNHSKMVLASSPITIYSITVMLRQFELDTINIVTVKIFEDDFSEQPSSPPTQSTCCQRSLRRVIYE